MVIDRNRIPPFVRPQVAQAQFTLAIASQTLYDKDSRLS